MQIVYLGHSCFRLTANDGTSVITDPYTRVGYTLQPTQADIVTISHGHFDHNYLAALRSYDVLASEAKRYSYKGIEIEGKKSFHDPLQGKLRGENVIFHIRMDGLHICHVGDLGEACSTELLAKLGKPDVLLLPIGGTYTIDANEAKEYVEKVAPKAVIPMHYKPQDGSLEIASAENFLKFFKETEVEKVGAEISLSTNDLTAGKTRILYMERRE